VPSGSMPPGPLGLPAIGCSASFALTSTGAAAHTTQASGKLQCLHRWHADVPHSLLSPRSAVTVAAQATPTLSG
jgi:hypothetical protein